MTATLSSLIAEARNLISDLSGSPEISDDVLTDFINQCIRDLSSKFPRIIEYTVSTTLNTRIYDLETVHKDIISVEYPTGEDPPEYLKRRAYTHPLFWQQDGFYDFIKTQDADSDNPPQIYISVKPPASKTITLKVTAEHNPLLDPGDSCTVDDRHLSLIGLYVRWKVLQYLASAEELNPGALSGMGKNLEESGKWAEASYYTALQLAIKADSQSASMPWKADKYDGRY